MPTKREWTEADDVIIREMEAAGLSSAAMARVMGCSATTMRLHCVRIGLTRFQGHRPPPKPETPEAKPEPVVIIDRSAEPLPAGHPISWGAIVAGTCIEHMEYPT